MHNNSTNNLPGPGLTYLENDAVLKVSGADAMSFLQGQLSQDLQNIEIGAAKLAGLSNPKGRLIATLYIYREKENSFYLILPNGLLKTVKTHLQKYIMRSKVNIEEAQELNLYGSWGESANESIESLASFQLAKHCDLTIHVSDKKSDNEFSEVDEWNKQKILKGIPDVRTETSEHFVAQMLNLDLLDAISFSKGCYTGQEIIARMQHLGRIKRRVLTLKLDNGIALGEKLVIADQTLGEVVNIVKLENKYLALVCVQLDKLNNLTSVDKPEIITSSYSIPEMTTLV